MKSESKSAEGKQRCATCRLKKMWLCILIQPEHTQIATLFQEASSVFSAYNSMRENTLGPIGTIMCFWYEYLDSNDTALYRGQHYLLASTEPALYSQIE